MATSNWFGSKVAWVTGGGSGIGRSLAVELAKRGAHVAVSGRRMGRLEQVASEIEAHGVRALALPCDVTDDAAVAECADRVAGELGGLDIAVANAGLSVAGKFEDLDAEEWRLQMDVNVLGAVSTARHALPHLRQSRGRLGLVGSVAAFASFPRSSGLLRLQVRPARDRPGPGPGAPRHRCERHTPSPRLCRERDRPGRQPGRLRPRAKRPPAQEADVECRESRPRHGPALYKRKREYVFTGHGKLGAWLGKHAPGLIHFAATRR